MKLARVLIGALSVSLVVLSLVAFGPLKQISGPTWRATWVFHASSLAEAKNRATAIVVGRVVDIKAGPDIVVPAQGEPNNEDRLQTQHVTFEVVKTYKGQPTERVTVFRTGTDSKYIEGDRPYRVGETHLLFIEPKADARGLWLVISPEGRFKIERGQLVPEAEEGFAAALSGRDLFTVERALAAAK